MPAYPSSTLRRSIGARPHAASGHVNGFRWQCSRARLFRSSWVQSFMPPRSARRYPRGLTGLPKSAPAL
eukprot:14312887-Alexandrium_andersonii.AAC.1